MAGVSKQRHVVINGDSRRLPLADESVHACVTSPPYFALRAYGKDGREVGRETTPQEYVAAMVAIFRDVRRVLRKDGTLWLNVGDSWQSGKGLPGGAIKWANGEDIIGDDKNAARRFGLRPTDSPIEGLKSKDCIGVPWMLAFALRDDGWYWRGTVTWKKKSPMPSSVKDRPTPTTEPILILSKSKTYTYDWFADTEPSLHDADIPMEPGWSVRRMGRDVWELPHTPFKGAHFAVMSRYVAERCIRLACPQGGCCPACGRPRERVVGRMRVPTRPGLVSKSYEEPPVHPNSPVRTHKGDICGNRDPARHVTAYRDEGWRFRCSCERDGIAPCVVLDPFGGAGTTASAANLLGHSSVSVELYGDNCRLALDRIAADERKHEGQKRKKWKEAVKAGRVPPLKAQKVMFDT